MANIVASQKEAAAALGITPRQMRHMMQEHWFPPDARTAAGYDVDKIREARDQRSLKGSATHETSRKIRLAQEAEKLRTLRTEADRKELRLERERRNVIPRAGVELFAATLLTSLGDELDQLPNILANQVPRNHRKKIRQFATDQFDRIRQQLRDTLEREARHIDEQLATE